MSLYRIHHCYDIGDRSIFIESDRDPSDAAAYLQFKAEELFGDDSICLSNLAIASGLVALYGCHSGHRCESAVSVDMHEIREERCGEWYERNYDANPKIVRSDSDILSVLKPLFGDQ